MILQSFEEGGLAGVKALRSLVKIDTTHQKDGISSLLWEMNGDAVLSFYGDVGYRPFQEGGPDQNRDHVIFWIYQEEQTGTPLTVGFYKKGRRCCGFSFGMEFTGWRTCWVPYADMEGTAEPGMDEIRMTRAGEGPARLWIDQLISASPIDPRHPIRDAQVPFVNLRADQSANAHWMSLYRYACLKQQQMSAQNGQMTEEENRDMARIEERLEQFLLSANPWPKKGSLVIGDDEFGELLEKFNQFHLVEQPGYVSGVTVDAACQKAAYPKAERARLTALTASVDIKICGQIMADAAWAWHVVKGGQKAAVEKKFLLLFRHLLDQGWAAGSGLGTAHHLGYPMRFLYTALFLMRDCLNKAGLLDQAADMMAWYTGQGRIFREDCEIVGESMDTLNTLLQGILESILMQSSRILIYGCLKAFCHSFSLSFLPAPGLRGPFKEDGSVFHHCGHYPAYAMGGFKGAAPVVYCLSGTAYRISQEAHASMESCLLATRLYCNRYNWLVSMSSRHPKGIGEMSQISSLEPYYYMAAAGTPDGREAVDPKMAAALLRLAEYVDFAPAAQLRQAGFEPEAEPEGSFVMNYACALLHRRKHWLAGVRGHSRYLWGSEIYEKNNLYGRYINYGFLQILGSGSPVNNRDSGFCQEGWDWNCFPGTTAVRLPLEQLKARVCVVDATAGFEEMLISDEAFAGGISMDKRQGAFGLILHGHGKYDGSFRARKSWFFFDNRIICLGSSIEDGDESHEVITTLYQTYLTGEQREAYLGTEVITGLSDRNRYDSVTEETVWLTDPCGNRYRIPKGHHITLSQSMQKSKAQDSCEDTAGPFSKAWLVHGIAPDDAGYEYMIQVPSGIASDRGDAGDEPPYRVRSRTRQLHAVTDPALGITSYVFFHPCAMKPEEPRCVKCVSAPCLVMERLEEDVLTLSVCDPDLRFYEGTEADQVDGDGNQKEVSLYSRAWKMNESTGRWVKVRLAGVFVMDDVTGRVRIRHEEADTVAEVFCISGRITQMCLKRS